jgi:hypothetical protein
MANSIFINTGGGSSGGALPTAPKGQVLISQGDGVTPIFSNKPTFYTPTAPVDLRTWRISTENDGNLYFSGIFDDGTPSGKKVVIDPYGGGLSTIYGSLFALNGSVSAIFHSFVEQLFSALASSGAQGNVGNLAQIQDSTVNTPGAIVSVGGGTFHVLARWDGTNWKVIA